MKSVLFGKIEEGFVKLDRYSQKEAVEHEGARVIVEIDTPKNIRTAQQNKYLWGVVYKEISEYTGYTNEEVHQVFGERFLSYEKNGHKFVKSTTKLSTKEFSQYVDKVIQYAGEKFQVSIPPAEIQ